MRKTVSDLLARESADWYHRGLIDANLSERLGHRYARHDVAFSRLTAWLGMAAILLLGMAMLSLIGLSIHSPVVGGLLLGAISAAFCHFGLRMATDPAQRHPVTGSALVTIGLAAAYGTMVLLCAAISEPLLLKAIFFSLMTTAVLGASIAYMRHLRWPLLLALLCMFHGIGAWHQYACNGQYYFAIQDPSIMAPIAALCALWGLWHQHAEHARFERFAGFGRLYVIFGLLYLNCSLWLITLDLDDKTNALAALALFTISCIAQIVLGARLKESKLIGFGIVFLGIDLYTRFFEHFWNRLSMGMFLLLAGLSGVLLGWLFERRAGAFTR